MNVKHLTLNDAAFVLTAALFTIAGGTLFASDDSDMLNDAAMAYRSNLDSLVSLAGHVSMLRESDKDGTKSVSEKTIQFAYDWKTGGEYFFSRTDSPSPPVKEGNDPQRFGPLFEAQLFTNGLYYRVIHKVGDKGKKSVMVDAKPFSRPEFYNGAFVPPFFLSYEGAKVDELLTMYAEHIDDPTFDGGLNRDGDVFVLSRFVSDPEKKLEIGIDLSKSGNPVRIEREVNRNGRVSNTTLSWEWEQINGVWIPLEVARTVTTSDSDSKKVTSTVLKWHDCQVNEPVDDAIHLRSLGVYRGDRLEDVRTGEKSIFEDRSLPVRATLGNKLASIAFVIALTVFAVLVRRRRTAVR